MSKIIKIFIGFCAFILSFVLFVGCDSKDELKISQGSTLSQEQIEAAESLDKKSYEGLEDVFLDTKWINQHGIQGTPFKGEAFDKNTEKIVLLVFGKNNCTYCDKLKDDIKASNELKEELKAHYAPYYVNTSYSKKHILLFDREFFFGEEKILSTAELLNAYVKSPMRPTPTLVFLNSKGEAIYELPGYLPSDKILKLLKLIHELIASGNDTDKSFEQISKYINEQL